MPCLGFVSVAITMPFGKQLQALEHGVPIVVATPGRLIDLMHRGAVDLSDIEITVLDEADLMSDMGFMPAVKEILDATGQGGQRLLFSATLDKDVDALVKKYLRDPIEHAVESAGIAHGEMDHHVFFVKQEVGVLCKKNTIHVCMYCQGQVGISLLQVYGFNNNKRYPYQ